jgi:hypothetical protein
MGDQQTAFFVVDTETVPGRDAAGDLTTVERERELAVYPAREDAEKHAAGIEGARVVEKPHDHHPAWSAPSA